jgi:hypothetical protein
MDLYTAYAASRPAEVSFAGTASTAGIAPPVPVHPGDRIEVRGVMVHDPGRAPIVHWTHHDPQGRHADGFIRLHGRVYA